MGTKAAKWQNCKALISTWAARWAGCSTGTCVTKGIPCEDCSRYCRIYSSSSLGQSLGRKSWFPLTLTITLTDKEIKQRRQATKFSRRIYHHSRCCYCRSLLAHGCSSGPSIHQQMAVLAILYQLPISTQLMHQSNDCQAGIHRPDRCCSLVAKGKGFFDKYGMTGVRSLQASFLGCNPR